jgi:hypothetical protein
LSYSDARFAFPCCSNPVLEAKVEALQALRSLDDVVSAAHAARKNELMPQHAHAGTHRQG